MVPLNGGDDSKAATVEEVQIVIGEEGFRWGGEGGVPAAWTTRTQLGREKHRHLETFYIGKKMQQVQSLRFFFLRSRQKHFYSMHFDDGE